MKIEAPRQTQMLEVESDLVAGVLAPYKEPCRYLRNATILYDVYERIPDAKTPPLASLLTAKGEFSIPESCYIADTGHFNSVEFNICYNQLAYTLLAYGLNNGLIGSMKEKDIRWFKEHQLPSMLIVEFSSSFKRPIDSRHFEGSVTIQRISVKKNIIFIKTCCTFSDDFRGFSKGEVLVAIVAPGPRLADHSH